MIPIDRIAGLLTGRVEVEGPDGVVFSGPNQVTNYGRVEFIRDLMAGNLDALVWAVAVGKGGDFAITPPHPDTGQRVAPDPSETGIRSLVGTVDVTVITRDPVTGEITYSALARREQVISPDINEFALMTRDGRMIAHFVTDALMPGDRAEKKPKNNLMFWIIRWTVEFTGA